jgi:hypothetical protein
VGSHGINLPAASMALNQIPTGYLDFARAHYSEYVDSAGRPATSASTFFSAQVANPFAGVITNPNSSLRTATVTRAQLLYPFPQYTAVTDYRPHIGTLSYNGLQVNVQKRYSRGLSMTGSYVWSKSLDTGGPGNNSGNGTAIEDIYNLRNERSVSNFDVPHRVVVSGVWEMPFYRKTKALLPRILARGWQMSGTYIWQRGTPFNVITSGFLNYGVRRPDRVAGSDASYDLALARDNVRTGKPWFNSAAFVTPTDYRLGDASRNYSDVRRDNYRNINLSVARNFGFLHERARLQFRAEFLNALNQVIFGTPGRDLNNPATLGIVTTQGNTPRSVQAVMRITF